MQILIVALGKESSSELAEIQDEYEKRLRPFTTITWKLLPASHLSSPEQIRKDESEQLLDVFKPSDSIILLDERGQQQTNEKFATTFERLSGSQGRIIFVIGGAYGVNDEVRSRAAFVWSLSQLVFPHQLVRVMLLEQLYRTFMVQQNHPYHHS
jgi:23S rRNA (pseudouridine1915-N3)-methyltransferase